jgi:hypothetical protein
MLVLGQLVAAAPDDATSWLRLSRAVLQIKPRDDREKALLLDRASTAAYIAYQRARDRNVEADSLSVLGRTLADRQQWRGALDSLRLSLELRETADLRSQYEKLRAEHGFRLLDYTVDSDSISPRALLPVLRGAAGPAHRLLLLWSPLRASKGLRLPASEKAALRRRPQARRTLRRDAARGSARRSSKKRLRNRPSSRSSCVTASPSCAFPARPMCCRAPGNAASPVLSVNTSGGDAVYLPDR